MFEFNPPPPEEDELPHSEVYGANPTIPHSREAEEAVVGSVLINESCFPEVARILKSDDFYVHRLRWIWEAFEEMSKNRNPIDLLTISEELDKAGRLAEIGGPAYLTSVVNVTPTFMNAMEYAKIVVGYSDRRKGINFANNMATAAFDMQSDFDLRGQVMTYLQTTNHGGHRRSAKEAASEAIDIMVSNPRFCKWYISDLDNKVGGLFSRELEILAGYQGTGKSALMIHAARSNAEHGKRVVLMSQEMTASQIWMRMSCGDLMVDLNQVRSGRVSDEKKTQVVQKAAKLADLYQGKIIIYEGSICPQDALSAAILEQPDIMFIDHLGLITGKPAKSSLMEWYNETIRFLRQMIALEENCNVCLLHQINRDAFKNARRPSMHDLAFAGENDPDGVYLIHRTNNDQEGPVKDVEILTEKSRFGWTGVTKAKFNVQNQRFAGIAPEEPEPEERTDYADRD